MIAFALAPSGEDPGAADEVGASRFKRRPSVRKTLLRLSHISMG